SMSDRDLVKHIEREAQKAVRDGLAKEQPPAPSPAVVPPVGPPMPSGGTLAAKLFSRRPPSGDDWQLDVPEVDPSVQSSSVDLRTAAASAKGLSNGDSKHRADESDVLAHALLADDRSSAVNLAPD